VKSLEIWEQIRIFAYIFSIVGVVIFVLGLVVSAAAFGTSNGIYSLITLIGDTFVQGGIGCGAVSTLLALLSRDTTS